MTVEMKVPSVGESVTEVTIASWIKKEGDYVKVDEIICELESDKATFELPSEAEGILHIIGLEGETLSIGAPICTITEGNAPLESVSKTITDEEKKPDNTVEVVKEDTNSKTSTGVKKDIIIPSVGESITEVVLSSWTKKQGDYVNIDEIICELESDKATFELPAPISGILDQIAKEGATVEVGGLIGTITETTEKPASSPKAETPKEDSKPDFSPSKDSYAAGYPSPSAAKILAEKEISPSAVSGSGVGGRITKEDALNANKNSESPTISQPTNSQPEGDRETRREKMTSIRKTIAKRLVAVKNETAMLTTFNEVDMKPIMDLRKEYKERFKEIHGVGLGFMSFFTKACSIALLEFPWVNAFIDGEEIVFNDFTDISIAVSSPKGLLVPVIRNAEKLDFAGIESEVVRLALKAREGKLTLPEMTGGTFTITNGGIFGSMLSTPIINAPQSAILGMHNIVERPVVINGQIEIRPIMYVALSYDHRIIDGKDSVSFLVRVKQLLEDPTRMLLGV